MRSALPSLVLTLLAGAPHHAADGVAWSKGWEDTLALAKEQRKVVFVAVNMDGEKANDRMVSKVYVDKSVAELSRATLNLVASAVEHAPAGKPCPRFDDLECMDHRRVDNMARKETLKPDAQGYVIAPQHVFLGPDGKVLLSVPYEIGANELSWCFVTALQKLDPAAAPPMPAGAHAPRRLILGGVFDPSTVPGGGMRTLTRAEVLERIKTLRKSGRGQWEDTDLIAILSSDEPEAVEFISQELKGGATGGGGGGGGRGGGGGGGKGGGIPGANTPPGGEETRHSKIMHAIGVYSPAAYWEIAAEYVGDSDVKLRDEAIVALEQLAAPESVKVLQSALAKEDEKPIQKDILRALGTAGANDKNVRALLLKKLKSEKNELLRLNAIVAAGSLAAGDDLAQALAASLENASAAERTAAACAMALTRDPRFATALETAAKDARDAEAAKVAALALAIVRGGDLTAIARPLKAVCKDSIDRERFFGRPDK